MKLKMFGDDLITVGKAAKQLSRPRLAIYRMVERGDILGIDVGGVLFVPTEQVERMKKELEVEAADLLATASDCVKDAVQE